MTSSGISNKKNNHEMIGTPYLSGNPVMDKIDQLERDMTKQQREAHEMIELLRSDIKVQRLLRHESHAAMDRLHEIKTDMVMKLDQMKEYYEGDRKRLLRESARQIEQRDDKIRMYESELGSARKLLKKLLMLLIGRVLRIGERLTGRFAREKANAAHIFE